MTESEMSSRARSLVDNLKRARQEMVRFIGELKRAAAESLQKHDDTIKKIHNIHMNFHYPDTEAGGKSPTSHEAMLEKTYLDVDADIVELNNSAQGSWSHAPSASDFNEMMQALRNLDTVTQVAQSNLAYEKPGGHEGALTVSDIAEDRRILDEIKRLIPEAKKHITESVAARRAIKEAVTMLKEKDEVKDVERDLF